ncbi:dynein intermediate chain 3, ciliary-like isoform X2 [Cephus cinctus]|uniref:Dynein intermediate chain 3, ciliary-like isoform X2 n=1 Tax=Cephus cinctus TaxID=211228 RepID=A0AAJ7W107_CEPCN|nr:dynein intermediate chain 3, ciliary-like isoform X2 [Cephus cinctus]
MEIQYVYVKTRSQFGKQCFFDEFGPSVDENIATNPEITADYITRNPCHVGVQKSKQYALHEIQTSDAVTKESGMFHTEGGWPKELNPKDEEATMRFRRRVEKDDNWAPKMNTLMEPVEHCVLQNNAVNIYENFFDDMVPTELVLPLAARTVNVYADPQLNVRPVTHLSWSPDHGKRLAVSYCLMEFQKSTNDLSSYSYIWDIENPNKAFMALKAFCPSVVIEFNPRDPSMLISGLMSGQVCNWDIRTGNVPVQVSELQYSHRDPANLALWINSKTNSELFSASTCGTMKWWDIRKLREPTETLVLDLDNPLRSDEVRAIGVSALQFEATMGTKFMAGMENGTVISGSRKGKNPAEKLALRFRCHYGPVVAIDRNPFSTKNFLTVGDWTVKIWAEDTKEGCLISTIPRTTILNGGCWSTSRYSVFYVIDMSGQLEVYDLLVGMEGPVRTLRLCEDRLGAIAPHEEGKLVAVGSSRGNVYLVESSEAFTVNGKNDKALMTSYLDRCSRYEKAIDNRLKEVKLAQRIIFEEVLEPVLTRDRSKVKNKDKKEKVKKKEKDKDKGKEKDKDKFDIEHKTSLRQKSRSKERAKEKSEEKDKKKSKSKRAKDGVTFPDDPELVTVELQYYETIQKEIEKYANIEDTEQEDPASKFESPGKRKKLEESRDKDARQKSDKDDQMKQIVILKKFAEPQRESQDLTDRLDLDMVDDVNASVVLQESKEKIKSPGKASPGARKHSRRAKGFRLKEEKPCGTEICQPTVCCLAKIVPFCLYLRTFARA